MPENSPESTQPRMLDTAIASGLSAVRNIMQYLSLQNENPTLDNMVNSIPGIPTAIKAIRDVPNFPMGILSFCAKALTICPIDTTIGYRQNLDLVIEEYHRIITKLTTDGPEIASSTCCLVYAVQIRQNIESLPPENRDHALATSYFLEILAHLEIKEVQFGANYHYKPNTGMPQQINRE